MASILHSVPETLVEELYRITETDTTATHSGAATSAPTAVAGPPAIDWMLVARVFIALVLVGVIWRKLCTRRARKSSSS